MLTQQNILDRLNQMAIRYNLTWYDIQYDADKSIAKINAFLGASYPGMSSILLTPDSTYSVRTDGVDIPIIHDEYIHSIVLPFIAMEVLSRDEEFTTIYNKYANEVEEGLFTMFQREFNRVPLVFRQQPDQGVFFAADSALATIQRNKIADLPVFKFRVIYHINNVNITLTAGLRFVEDTRGYLYNDIATVKGWNIELLSTDNTTAFRFLGWSRGPNEVSEEFLAVSSKLTMVSDVHLYARWEETPTLTNIAGVVSIKDVYKPSLTYLVVPDVVNNMLVREIATDFLLDSDHTKTRHAVNLMNIILPKYLTKIKTHAFNGFKGTEIILPETEVSMTYPGIVIEHAAFANTPNLEYITIPSNVMTMEFTPFPVVSNKTMHIKCRRLKSHIPEWDDTNTGWHTEWYAQTDGEANYNVHVEWGYNE